jgi:phenylacetate-CoA ligase
MSALQTPARLVIAGAGPARASLAARAAASPAAHRIALAGELRGPARDAALAAADLLVLPSLELPGGRSEGLPVSVLEAMAAGVPVIATATGGLCELPDAAITRVRPGDPAALAAAIDALLADPARRRRQVAAGRACAAAADWAEVGARLWQHMLAADGRGAATAT